MIRRAAVEPMIYRRTNPVFASAPAHERSDPNDRRHRLIMQFLVLVCLLPLFGQTFYYLAELPVPYLLSKAWPVIVLPLTAYAMIGASVPYKTLYAALLAYLIGISPILSMINFGTGLDALTTTVKIWPFTFYLAFAVLLAWLRPAPLTLTRAAIVLGGLTYPVMVAIWVLAPAAWYTSDGSTKLLLYEVERGYRIYMPMFFGLIFVFYLARRFNARREWWPLPTIAVCFGLLLHINKQRVVIAAAALVVAYALYSGTRGAFRKLMLAVGLLGSAVVLMMVTGSPLFERILASFGGSASVRQRSIQVAFDFLGDDPVRWLIGAGATTRFSDTTLADIFGDKQFYLADIGWLGIVFEYGIIGALLVAAVYIAGFFFTTKVGRTVGTPFAAAMGDYAMYLLLTSLVYSFVFTTGELATIMAVSAYLLTTAAISPEPRGPAPVPIFRRPTVTVRRHSRHVQTYP